MDDAEKFVEDFLAHYASQFYDPAKAHEYYLKTRELKGRRSTSQLKGAKKKEAWAYINKQVGDKRKADFKSAAQANKAQTQALQQKVADKRQQLSDKLKALSKAISQSRQAQAQSVSGQQKQSSAALTERQKAESKRISDEASAKIKALPPLPTGLSKEEHSKAAAQRAAEIASIRGDASNQRKALTEGTKSERGSLSSQSKQQRQNLSDKSKNDLKGQRDQAAAERERISGELKATVAKARANYQTLRDNLKKKYETTLDKEFTSLKTGSLAQK